jgi:alcohol dehydrogenase class IV
MSAVFELALPARITFGAGRAADLPSIVTGLGSRVLVVTGGTPGRVEHLLAPVRAAAEAMEVVPLAGEPSVDDARRATAAGRALAADVVLAVGGGSAIDLAKAAAALLATGTDPMDHLEVVGLGQPLGRDPLPLVAAPTTAGTGAEVTANAVLAVPEHGVKVSLRHPRMVPRHAVVDPELTLGSPPAVTAASGMDALTQCLEPFVSNRANPMTDGWARTGLLAAGRSLRTAHAQGADLAARTDMALCSLAGGLALANAKLGAVHGFAGVLGGMTGAAHGAICAALLVPVCRANLARADDALRGRFDEVARWLVADERATAEDGLAWLEVLVAELGIPALAAHRLRADQAGEVAAGAARASSTAGNPVALTVEELTAIYLAALGG